MANCHVAWQMIHLSMAIFNACVLNHVPWHAQAAAPPLLLSLQVHMTTQHDGTSAAQHSILTVATREGPPLLLLNLCF